ncbi:hypothetical protein ACF1AE_25480 [Streptomyces sp. NPDC014986]|uniref:hypothetical protein n=1 Tax=Streptomyces sp. NPDC014986 TaxID=3364934 RepID=UPI003700C947
MFVSRSRYTDLQARHDHALTQLAATREELAHWKGSALRTVGRTAALTGQLDRSRRLRIRLARALRACVRYRARIRQLERQTDRLQQRLDDAVGLNDPAVLAGSRWQSTRQDGVRKGATS